MLFIIVFVYLFFSYTAGPISWDELWYIDLSNDSLSEPIILFRYTHIYLQKFFIFLFGDILTASKIFWLVIVGSTTFQIFHLSYRLSSKNLFVGIVSIYLFFIQKIVFQKYLGVTYPDFTVMFFGITMVNIYFSKTSNTNFKFYLLSILFLLAFKAKETSLPFIIILIAELLNNNNKQEIYSKIKMGLIAFLSFIILFITLDFFFLNDAFFSFKTSNFKSRVDFDLASQLFVRNSDDSFTFLLKSSMFVPITLYLFNIRYIQNLKASDKLVVLLPLFIIGFVSLTMITGKWNIEDRYYLPSIPLFCVFGTLVFNQYNITKFSNIKHQLVWICFFIGLLLLSYLVTKKINNYTAQYSWDSFKFHYSILFPLVVIMLLVIFSFHKQLKPIYTIALVLFCVLLYTSWDFGTNLIMIKNKDLLVQSQKRFFPFQLFHEQLDPKYVEKLFISENIHKQTTFLSRDNVSSKAMYNIYFNAHKKKSQIQSDTLIDNEIFSKKYSHILLLKNEDVVIDSMISNQYLKYTQDKFTLLVKK